MMTKNTFATMIVPSIAPKWMNAPRPLKTWRQAVRGRGDAGGPAPPRARARCRRAATAQPVVDEPAARDRGEADADRRRLAEIRDGAVDQIDLGADVVDEREQEEARDPGRSRLPT